MSYWSRSHEGSNRIVVGITSRSSQRDLQWLMDFIKGTFRDHVSDVKYLPISNSNRIDWERNVRTCSVAILYHTKRQGRINITDVEGALYDEELDILSTMLGRSNVLVVVDDLENCSDTERQRILDAQPSVQRFSSGILLFSEERKREEAAKKKEEFIKFLGIKAEVRDSQPSTTRTKAASPSTPNSRLIDPRAKKIGKTISDCKQKLPSIDFPQPRMKISIFSRSAESNYGWLVEELKTTCMARPVDVRAVYISNNASPFYSELSHCSFAILYHTKKQGRINITDVTDNLYDEELKDLSMTLGKENVIVVVDDLENADPSERERILRNQPSIGRLARGLFLFNEKKKNQENLEEIKQILKKKMPRIEVPRNDGRKADADMKYKASSMQSWSRESASSRVSSVDNEPSLTHRTEDRKSTDMSTIHNTTRNGDDDVDEPQSKKRNVDPMGPTRHSSQVSEEMERMIQETSTDFQERFTMMNNKWQEYHKMKEEETRDKIQRIQRENEELQTQNKILVISMSDIEESQKQILEAYNNTMQENEEKERTMEKLRQDLGNKDKIMADNQKMAWKMVDQMNDLKKKLSEKEKLEIEETRARNEAKRGMEKLRQDLRNKDRTIEEDKETIRMMGEKIKELLTKLSKDELEIKTINQTQLAMEKLQQDLRDKDKTIEENKETIRKMEKKIQKLEHKSHGTESNLRPEQAEQTRKQEMPSHESQRYKMRSPIPGEENGETNEKEMSNRDMKNGDWMEEDYLQDRPQRNSAVYDSGQNPAETQSLREMIEELRHTIQQKDEEIQKMKSKLEYRRY